MKNVVICCDGTGNQFGAANSNVVKIYQTLVHDGVRQVCYYHPGVGTMGDKRALSKLGQWWTWLLGMAFGYGLAENISDAYRFLMNSFEPGDRVYIFGFSRGAYTARALCGMLQMFGLLSSGNEGLIPYAMRLFKSKEPSARAKAKGKPSKFAIAKEFQATFGRECKPHFLGVWDTVSSVGWFDPIGSKPGALPFTRRLDDVAVIRHAVSLDERRAFFRQNLVKPWPRPKLKGELIKLKEVWFAGVHSDVGGGYADSELSMIPLRWMLQEAMMAHLAVDPVKSQLALHSVGSQPVVVCTAKLHNSLTPGWWLGEFWPKVVSHRVSSDGVTPEVWRRWIRLNLFRRRVVPEGAWLHASIFERMKLVPEYKPRNLPAVHETEPDAQSDPVPPVVPATDAPALSA